LADPVCTFVFSFFVLLTTIAILRDTLRVLMEATPKGLSYTEVRQCLLAIEGVQELHNLRLWSLTLSKVALSVHLALDNSVLPRDVLHQAGHELHSRFAIDEWTIQTEEYVPEMLHCIDCQQPKD